jgi:hypothetical protein
MTDIAYDNEDYNDTINEKARILMDSRNYASILSAERDTSVPAPNSKPKYKSRRGSSPPPRSPERDKDVFNKKFDPKIIAKYKAVEEIVVPKPQTIVRKVTKKELSSKTQMSKDAKSNLDEKKTTNKTSTKKSTKKSEIIAKNPVDKVQQKSASIRTNRDYYASLFDEPLIQKPKSATAKPVSNRTQSNSNIQKKTTSGQSALKSGQREREQAKKRPRVPSDSDSDTDGYRNSNFVPAYLNPYMMRMNDDNFTFRRRYREYSSDEDDEDDDALMESAPKTIEEEERIAERIAKLEDRRAKQEEDERRRKRKQLKLEQKRKR